MKTCYTLRDDYDSQTVTVCEDHAKEMPQVDGFKVTAKPADDDCNCEFCEQEPLETESQRHYRGILDLKEVLTGSR